MNMMTVKGQCVLWLREPLEYNGAQTANTGEDASQHPYDQEVQIRLD